MKAILLAALLLFTSSVNAMSFKEFLVHIPTAQYVTTIPCAPGATDETPRPLTATHACVEFIHEGTSYRVAVNSVNKNAEYVFTPKTEKFPDGKVPLDYFQHAGSI